MTNKIPEGFQNVVPSLIVENAAKAIDTYKKAFGATEDYRSEGPDGKIMHACITIGDTKLFIADPNKEMGCGEPTASSFYMYIENVDDTFKQASKAGLKEMSQPQDMFYGDRVGALKDAFGITWAIATHVKDVSPEELEEGKKQFQKKNAA